MQKARRRSSLKSCNMESDQFISTDKKSWRALPVPDLSKQKRSQSQHFTPSDIDNNVIALRKTVSFGDIQQRFYSQTLGDHPDTSAGPPISLDWDYHEVENIPLEDYESAKLEKKYKCEMKMSDLTRRRLLVHDYGFDLEDIRKATKETMKSSRQRLRSLKASNTVMRFEKTLKIMGLKTKSSAQARSPPSA
mmetsp:Transcript_11863/g.18200  ORF Transcript_11863/g.18200 Transcript_11863/m.18200 type:complete len:192 (-) Transcript_11863:7-582(-)